MELESSLPFSQQPCYPSMYVQEPKWFLSILYFLISCYVTAREVHIAGTKKLGIINRLKPNDPHMGRTAPLTSKRCILYIYSSNIGTEYFKHSLHSPFFFLFKMQFVS